MKTNSYRISISNLPPEGVDVTVEAPPDPLALPSEDRFCFDQPVHLQLHVSKAGEKVLVRGRGEARASCQCDRCLDPFVCVLPLRDLCYYFEDIEEEVIDLTEGVREDILIVLPQRFLCAEDCLGLCPDCGRKRTSELCECGAEEVKEDDPWSALDQIRGQLEQSDDDGQG